jgi:probable addiction module antidote protein
MAEIATTAGVSREGLYRSLSPQGNPELAPVAKVLKALGLQLTVKLRSAA